MKTIKSTEMKPIEGILTLIKRLFFGTPESEVKNIANENKYLRDSLNNQIFLNKRLRLIIDIYKTDKSHMK